MARYSFRCPTCGKQDTRTIPIARYDTVATHQYCECGTVMKRVFDVPELVATGRWRDEVASIGPAEFMRREDPTSAQHD